MSAEITALLIEVNRSRSAAAGLDASQYTQVTAGGTDLAQWPPAFLRAAEGHLDLAHQAENQNRAVSAALAYRDASRWFHFASCVPDADAATVRDAETRATWPARRTTSSTSPPATSRTSSDWSWTASPHDAKSPPYRPVWSSQAWEAGPLLPPT